MYGHLGLWDGFLHPTIYLFQSPNYSFIEDGSLRCGIKSSHGLNFVYNIIGGCCHQKIFKKPFKERNMNCNFFFAIM